MRLWQSAYRCRSRDWLRRNLCEYSNLCVNEWEAPFSLALVNELECEWTRVVELWMSVHWQLSVMSVVWRDLFTYSLDSNSVCVLCLSNHLLISKCLISINVYPNISNRSDLIWTRWMYYSEWLCLLNKRRVFILDRLYTAKVQLLKIRPLIDNRSVNELTNCYW